MGFFDKLKNGLNKTKTSFDEKMNDIFSNFRKVDEDLLEELEEALIMSDVGANTSATIINNLRERVKKENIKDEQGVREALRKEIQEIFNCIIYNRCWVNSLFSFYYIASNSICPDF